MKQLEQAILSYTDWGQPGHFEESISNNSALNETEKAHFMHLWRLANDVENWKDVDLVLGCKNANNSIREVSSLDDRALAVIVRAASYQWK
jgi:hypothetical protein